MKLLHTKKFRHGSVSLALTLVIVAAVILINAIVTALGNKYLWYIDMTPDQLYSLSDEAKGLLSNDKFNKEVTITFCTDQDVLEEEATTRYPLYTALDIRDEFENVKVRFVDIYSNPSAVQEAQMHTGVEIGSKSIILSSGSKHRVYTLESMYTFDSTGNEIIGYNGEQRLVSGLLSVTQTETPVACFTVNHGERDNPNFEMIAQALYDAGYEAEPIDLSKEQIPEDCRLIVTIDPQNDFSAEDDPYVTATSDELKKLELFLDNQNSMMVFFDNGTPYQENFETFLASWGIGIARRDEAALLVRDKTSSFDPEGLTNVATYIEGGLGASLTTKLREKSNPKSVLFPYAAVMYNTFEPVYSESGDYWVANNNAANGANRQTYDAFISSKKATAEAGGSVLSADELNALGMNVNADVPFSYMKVTRETQMQNNKEVYSYLLACASTDFAAATLNSGYGNHTVLTYAASMLGRDMISVSIDCKYFSDMEISSITAAEANQYTVVLTVVPAAVIFIAGIYIMVRRKYA